MADLNNTTPLALPYYQYVNLFGDPVFNAKIYVGIANTDPLNEDNQIDVLSVQTGGTTTILEQPIRTNSAGHAVNDVGDVVYPVVSNDYSITVLDQNDALIYEEKVVYIMDSEDSETEVIKLFPVVSAGLDSFSVAAKPISVNLIIDGDLQRQGDDLTGDNAYTYTRDTGVIKLAVPLTGNEIVEIQYGAITSASVPVTNLPFKDLVNDYGAAGDAVYDYTVLGELIILSGTDDTEALQAALQDFESGAISALTAQGNFWLDSAQINLPINTNIIGLGTEATRFIHSTTSPNQNMFIGYNNGRVSNISLSNMTLVGDKQKDNSIGTPLFRTLGADGVKLNNIRTEGGNGIWIGEDNVSNLYGSMNVEANNIFVNDCALFGFYIRGVEVPAGGFDQKNNTNNVAVNNLTVKGSNVGYVTADRDAYDLKLTNYNCTDSDNTMQLEAAKNVSITNIYMADSTNVWPATAPTPYKQLAILSSLEEFSIVSGYINVPVQLFSNATSGEGVRHGRFTNIDTGDVFRITTLNNNAGTDTNKNLFSNLIFDNCYFPRNATTFFQSDTTDQGGNPVAFWRDWDFKGCTWSNDSTGNPIQMVVGAGCVGSFNIDKNCNFLGKPPRAIVAQKCTFDATVRAGGLASSDIQFTATAGTDPAELEILRIGGNIEIEGEVTDVNYDVVHDNGSYDVGGVGSYCRVSNASAFHDEGISATGFVTNRFNLTVGLFKTIEFNKTGAGNPNGVQTPDYVGQKYIDSSNIWMSYGLLNTNWTQIG